MFEPDDSGPLQNNMISPYPFGIGRTSAHPVTVYRREEDETFLGDFESAVAVCKALRINMNFEAHTTLSSAEVLFMLSVLVKGWPLSLAPFLLRLKSQLRADLLNH